MHWGRIFHQALKPITLITLSLGTKTNPRGPGFWKLNSHFLKDLDYIIVIKETISKVSNDYKEDKLVDAILLWDVMKMQITICGPEFYQVT